MGGEDLLRLTQGEGSPPPPPDPLGIRSFTNVLPAVEQLELVIERVRQAGGAVEQSRDGSLVRDPSQICILMTAENWPDNRVGES